jgi:hypothetical protein
MWLICWGLCFLLTILNWVLTVRKSRKALWASAGALSFTALALLMEVRQVLYWVNWGDWGALEDVVPSLFPTLTGLTVLAILINLGALLYGNYRKA